MFSISSFAVCSPYFRVKFFKSLFCKFWKAPGPWGWLLVLPGGIWYHLGADQQLYSSLLSDHVPHLPTWWALPCHHLLPASFRPHTSPSSSPLAEACGLVLCGLGSLGLPSSHCREQLSHPRRQAILHPDLRTLQSDFKFDSKYVSSSPNNISQEVFVSWEHTIFVSLIALVIFLCYYPALNLFLTY